VRFAFIDGHKDEYPVGLMCQILNVSRSGYYEWLERDTCTRKLAELKLARVIEDVHKGSYGTYGSPRIHRYLKATGVTCSRARVERTMRKYGIRAKTKRKFRATTNSKHSFSVASNVLNRSFKVEAENRAWVADITAIDTKEGWVYLAAILDLFSRKIVGWAMDDNMTRDLTLRALDMACRKRKPAPGLIHHSDRGSQYASDDYQRALASQGIVCSMSRKGNCWDNAPMESFFHTLKTEHVYWESLLTRTQAIRSVSWWIESFYNRVRLHSAIDYKAPEAYERGLAA
jgi:putative transposase